jgi:hypothetical protein
MSAQDRPLRREANNDSPTITAIAPLDHQQHRLPKRPKIQVDQSGYIPHYNDQSHNYTQHHHLSSDQHQYLDYAQYQYANYAQYQHANYAQYQPANYAHHQHLSYPLDQHAKHLHHQHLSSAPLFYQVQPTIAHYYPPWEPTYNSHQPLPSSAPNSSYSSVIIIDKNAPAMSTPAVPHDKPSQHPTARIEPLEISMHVDLLKLPKQGGSDDRKPTTSTANGPNHDNISIISDETDSDSAEDKQSSGVGLDRKRPIRALPRRKQNVGSETKASPKSKVVRSDDDQSDEGRPAFPVHP